MEQESRTMKHVEMIIDYVVDGDDFQYCDNHGRLIRCKDCKHFDEENGVCKVDGNGGWQADDFCSTGERKEQ
jgi:hypothetical protein